MVILFQKRVKIVDSDITVNTVWCPKYLYVITKNINVLENVTLKIRDGTKTFILNGTDDFLEPIASLTFATGSKLCSKSWSVQAVDEDNGYYVTSKNPNNGGVYFNGTLTDDPVTVDESKLSDKQKAWRKCCLKHYNKCTTKTKFVIQHLTVDHVELTFIQLAKCDSNISSITILNNSLGISLDLSYLTLNSLSIDSNYREYSKDVFFTKLQLILMIMNLLLKKNYS